MAKMTETTRTKIFQILMIYVFAFGGLAHANLSAKTDPVKDRPYVLVIQPSDNVTDALWYEAMDMHIKYAARDMNMDVDHFFAEDDRTKINRNVIKKIESGPKPDFLVFSNQIGMGVGLLMLCEDMDIKCFMYGSPLMEPDIEKYGGPRQTLKNWIGQIIPDDEQAGYDLAITLIEQARKTKKDNKDNSPIRIMGITGTSSTPASVSRTNGLRRAISSYQDVELLQIVSARWSAEIAANKYKLLTARYGAADIVWSASNDMALAVLDVAHSQKHLPKIGGFDFVPPAIHSLKEQGLSAVIGGHEMEIAYVLKLIRDYHDGNDFIEKLGATSLESTLITVTPDTISEYSLFFDHLAQGKLNYKAGLDIVSDDENVVPEVSMEGFKTRIALEENLR